MHTNAVFKGCVGFFTTSVTGSHLILGSCTNYLGESM